MQDPDPEEILRELERFQGGVGAESTLEQLPFSASSVMARWVVDRLEGGEFDEVDRAVVDRIVEMRDAEATGVLADALGDSNLAASRRLDLADALSKAPQTRGERTAAYRQIARSDAEPADRLRAVNSLWPLDRSGARDLGANVVEDVSAESLGSEGVLEQVEELAKQGSSEAKGLLVEAVGDESLPLETRLTAAQALERLGVPEADELLRQLTGENAGGAEEKKPKPAAKPPAKGGQTAVKSGVEEEAPPEAPRERRKAKRPAQRRGKESSTLARNLTILCLVIVAGTLFVLFWRRHT
jgi:hypothetical protein